MLDVKPMDPKTSIEGTSHPKSYPSHTCKEGTAGSIGITYHIIMIHPLFPALDAHIKFYPWYNVRCAIYIYIHIYICIYIYMVQCLVFTGPPPTHPIWYGGLPPNPPTTSTRGERYIDICIHAYTYILYTFAHTHSICVYTHTCKCRYIYIYIHTHTLLIYIYIYM